MNGANGVLVECPICRGEGVLSNNATDPQLQDDGDCHACSGGGSVDETHRAQLLDGMTDDALIALAEHDERVQREDEQRLSDHIATQREHDAELSRLLDAEHAHELAQRDREWWS